MTTTPTDHSGPSRHQVLSDVLTRGRRRAVHALRRGHRTVLLTQEWPKFGNFLYFWLHAYIRQEQGVDYRVLTNESTGTWLAQLPEVGRRLTVTGAQLRPWDQREWPPPPEYFQRFGTDYDRDSLDRFIREMILGSPLLAKPTMARTDGRVVVNIRRGDYYSEPAHRTNFGLDLESYLCEALHRATSARAVGGAVIVSDDIEWCRKNIDLLVRGYFEQVEYVDGSPEDDFRTISRARTLVCANSTFSYWGGYISSTLHGSGSHVIAPDFHARHVNGGKAYQLDDRWDTVHIEP